MTGLSRTMLRKGAVLLSLIALLFTHVPYRATAEEASSRVKPTVQALTVTESTYAGADLVTISNSIVTATIQKSNAVLKSLSYKGGPNLLDNGGSGYYILNYTQNGKNLKFAPNKELKYALTALDDEHADISLSLYDPSVMPFGYDMHFVLVKDVPGFYVYEILTYPQEVAGGAGIVQGRYAIRTDPNIFKYYAVDDERKGALPAPEELKNGEEVMDATIKLANGDVYTKYNHMVYIGDFQVTGLYGDHIGISQIRPSNDFVGGGPLQQRNTLHQTDTTPILLWHDHESHMGRSNAEPYQGWQKIYGPTLFYIHEGNGLDELWADAKSKAAQEAAKWPYKWLRNSLYAPDTRGNVTGQLIVDGKGPAKNAWVILGQPGDDFQDQNLDYLYYARTDQSGRFEVKDVRPGSYTLFATVNGEFDTFRYDGVQVGVRSNTKLPLLHLTPKSNGVKLWQIGTADRTAGEFRHGDDYHQWGNWLDYPLDFPNGVDFYIGKSSERTDWNYFQPVNKTPGEPTQIKVSAYDKSLAPWKIRFDLKQLPKASKGTLTFGLASSRNGSLRVELNGTEIANLASLPGPKTDSAVPRSAIHGYYRQIEVPFDTSLLKPGQNVLVLTHAQNIFDENGNRIRDLYTTIEYDAIKLEVGDKTVETKVTASGRTSVTREDTSPE